MMISNKGSLENAHCCPRLEKRLEVYKKENAVNKRVKKHENRSQNKRVKKHENRSRNWLDLPDDVTIYILQRVWAGYIFEAVQFVCVKWHNICKEPYMWRSIDMSDQIYYRNDTRLCMMCRQGVDRSCGQLNHISIGWYSNIDLLEYIIDRSPQLKSLHLVSCGQVFMNKRVQVANKLPNLEELTLSIFGIRKEVVENFGHNCPLLKSLTYDNHQHNKPDDLKEALLAIGQTMPGLSHLSLSDGLVTNDVLKAILDRCPHITSLDIRRCWNVKVDGDFGRTLALRVKNLTYQRKGD